MEYEGAVMDRMVADKSWKKMNESSVKFKKLL